MKKIILTLLIILLTGCSLSSAFVRENEKEVYLEGKYNIEMKIKNYGTIELELDADTAPITVTNFVNLVNDEFYNGLTLHRVVKDFMMQGGDPTGTGAGGSDKKIKGEFFANGTNNPISHKRGVISMARSNDYDSASSQFFIMSKDNESLDGYYAAFGHVTKGMDVVDKIMKKVGVSQEDDMEGKTVEASKRPIIEYIKLK